MKRIALVTVTYNAEKNLDFFLPSLIKNQDSIDACFFIDNNSKDKTVTILNEWKDAAGKIFNVGILPNTVNQGYTQAINFGIQKALDLDYDYILVTNNDIILESGAVAQLQKDADEGTFDALGVPASISKNEIGLGYNLNAATLLPKKDKPLTRDEILFKIKEVCTPLIDFPHGGTILFSKYFFKEIGLYDHHLFFGGDELDFLYRVTAYNAVHDPNIKCGASLRAFLLMDNFTKHNSGHKIIKAKRMLQGNARVNLKHRFTPTELGLYKEQQALIRDLSKDQFLRYVALYLFAIRGLSIEIFKYYFPFFTKKI